MNTRILAVVLLMGCGVEQPCVDNAVDCSDRTISVCESGHWVQLWKLRCEESIALSFCAIPRLPICATENQR